MRDPQRSNKATTPFTNYKPTLDTLEDRSLPGNTFLGLGGFTIPLASAAAKAATFNKVPAPNKSASSLSIVRASSFNNTTSTNQAHSTRAASASSLLSAVFASGSSSISQIAGNSTTSASSFNAIDNATWNSVANQANHFNVNVSPFAARLTGQSFSNFISTNNGSIEALSSAISTQGPASTTSPNSIYNLAEGDSGGFDARASIQAVKSKGGLNATQLSAAEDLKETVPNLSYTVDTTFGTPKSVINTSSPLTQPRVGHPITITTDFVKNNIDFFGVSTDDLNTLKNTDTYTWSVGNGTMVNLQQFVNNYPVYNAYLSSGVRPDGSLVIVNNTMIPNIVSSVNTSSPVLTPQQAIIAAATDAGVNIRGSITTTATVGEGITASFLNSSISIDPIPTKLEYLPIAPGETRLVYYTRIYVPNSTYNLEYQIDAVTGKAWQRQNAVFGDSYRVFKPPIAVPTEGVRTLETNPNDPLASPYGWLDINGRPGADYNYTRGNNVYARYDPNGTFTGTPAFGAPGNVFDFPMNLRLAPSTYANAATTQLFYSMNFYHDVLYKAGFTESAGNFQQNNYGRTQVALQGDPILAFAQFGNGQGGNVNNAFFAGGGVDGVSGRIVMFIWDLTGPNRDGSLDNQIIFHEATHGTSTRLAKNSYNTFENRGLGEGWSDYYALAMTLKPTDNKSTKRYVGAYVTGDPLGIRNYPYSYDMTASPFTYSDSDPAQSAHGDSPNTNWGGFSFYTMGEIFANTLNDMTLNMVEKTGYSGDFLNGDAGNNRALKLVTAGMALTASSPNALDARNGVIAADQMLYGGAYEREIWNAFARRGMGIYARPGIPATTNPATNPPIPFSIREDFTEPDYGDTTPPPPPVGGDGSNDALYEPNETSNAAFNLGALTGLNTLSNLQIKSVAAGRAADRDWFRFTPTKAGTLTINAEVSPSAGDLDLKVYRSTNGTASNLTEVGIGQGTKRVAGGSETVTIAVGAGISYFFNVQGFNGGKGNYNLNITAPS